MSSRPTPVWDGFVDSFNGRMCNNLLDENLSDVCDGRAKIMARYPAPILRINIRWNRRFCLLVIPKSWPATVPMPLISPHATGCATRTSPPIAYCSTRAQRRKPR
jgi:hypothetical protein